MRGTETKALECYTLKAVRLIRKIPDVKKLLALSDISPLVWT